MTGTISAKWLCIAAVVLIAPLASAQEEPVRYDNYKVVAIDVRDEAMLEQLRAFGVELMSEDEGIGEVHYLVSPQQWPLVTALDTERRVLIENMQSLIDAERSRIQSNRAARDITWFEEYKTNDEIKAYCDTLLADFPALISRQQIGTSVEGQPLWLYTISGTGGPANKPAIFYTGMLHAREWISPMTMMYVIDQLVRGYGGDVAVTNLLNRVKFYIIPVTNPDGYEYSWTTERLWRKNRRLNGNGTYGVDLNRNFSFGWGTQGSSGIPSDLTYRGPAPFSEPESSAVRDFLLGNPDIVTHIDFHSYSQLVLRPPGVQGEPAPPEPDNSIMIEVGDGMAAEILATSGEVYISQRAIDLYPAGGTCSDWAYNEGGAFSWTVELRDTGFYGFVLPADQIIPTGQEIFQAVLYMADYFADPFKLLLTELPGLVEANTATTLTIELLEISNGFDSGTLYYRFGDTGPFATEPLTQLSPTQLEATLPGAPCGTEIQWYVEAATADGQLVRSPEGAPANYYSTAAFEITTVVDDSFETLSNWTVGAFGDTATTGIWNQQDPEGTGAQPDDDVTVAGTQCWVTDGRAGSSLGSYDVDGGRTTLISPSYDLSAAGDPVLSYWRWYSNSTGAAPNADVFRVEISNDGTNWTLVEQVGPSGPETSGGWVFSSFNVADIVALTDNVKVRFVAEDAGSGSVVEAAIDEFSILDANCPPCPEDLTGDGVVDAGDLNVLLSEWGCTTGCVSDFTGDNVVDAGDLNVVLSNWGPCE